jgi:hypothetical protein
MKSVERKILQWGVENGDLQLYKKVHEYISPHEEEQLENHGVFTREENGIEYECFFLFADEAGYKIWVRNTQEIEEVNFISVENCADDASKNLISLLRKIFGEPVHENEQNLFIWRI